MCSAGWSAATLQQHHHISNQASRLCRHQVMHAHGVLPPSKRGCHVWGPLSAPSPCSQCLRVVLSREERAATRLHMPRQRDEQLTCSCQLGCAQVLGPQRFC